MGFWTNHIIFDVEDRNVDFSGLPNDLALSIGKCKFQGNLNVEMMAIPGGFRVRYATLTGAFVDLYDYSWPGGSVGIGPASIDVGNATKTQAGHATLTAAPHLDAGRIFYTRVALNNAGYDFFEKFQAALTHSYKIMFISYLSRYSTIYIILLGTSLGQQLGSQIDLDRIAAGMKFPRSELIITNYTTQEKFIYTKKTPSEENRDLLPPVDPAHIYQSFWISSNTPNTFLPIVVTISKPDAYFTQKVRKMVDGLNEYAAQHSDYAYGDFAIPEASHAPMFWEEIRIPAYMKKVIEPSDTWTRNDEYPKYHPANVSIVRDAIGAVDVRIAKYVCLHEPHKLIKLPGGEEYFAAFNDDPADDPKESPLLSIFKGLNQIVLSSPVMGSYRKMSVPSIATQVLPVDETGKATAGPPAPPQAPVKTIQPVDTATSPNTPKVLVLILLALVVLAAMFLKFPKK